MKQKKKLKKLKKKKKKGIKICSALQKYILFTNKFYITSWLIYSRVSYLKGTVVARTDEKLLNYTLTKIASVLSLTRNFSSFCV